MLVGDEVEVDLVGPLQLDGLSREDEILRSRRRARGDGGGLRVDVDLDVVGGVFDGGGVGRDEIGLGSEKGGDHALQQNLGVDERDAAE